MVLIEVLRRFEDAKTEWSAARVMASWRSACQKDITNRKECPNSILIPTRSPKDQLHHVLHKVWFYESVNSPFGFRHFKKGVLANTGSGHAPW